MTPLKLTLDTNCAINLFDSSSLTATSFDELSAIIRYAMSGVVQVSITTRVEDDLLKDKDEARRAEMLRILGFFPVIGSIGRWGVTTWDGGDLWATDDSSRAADDIQRILFPGLTAEHPRHGNRMNDVDHLVGHMINKRDIFVTDDRTILRNADTLKRSFGIVVMKPADCVEHIEDIESRQRPKTLPSDGIDPAYHSRALSGTATFDYSNNDHRFVIGEGQWLFETQWSKASNTSIYAYTDSRSIDALALAKGAEEITDIADASAYDFSSRVRSPKLGQTVIWRNVNGLYAATRIVSIKDDSRGDGHDELTFEYRILLDGVSFAAQ